MISILNHGAIGDGRFMNTQAFADATTDMKDLTAYVHIKQGTGSNPRFSVGNSLPLVTAPFGMNAFALQTTSRDGAWYYHPTHRHCEGIRLTHQPSPWVGDYGHFVMMPQSGQPFPKADTRSSGFDELDMNPGHLSVYFRRYHATMALVPTERCAMMEIVWDTDEVPRFALLPFDFLTEVQVDAEHNTLRGWTNAYGDGTRKDFKTYFELRFDKPIDLEHTMLTQNDGSIRPGCAGCEKGLGISIAFHMRKGETLTVRLGTSYLSPKMASQAITRELGERPFALVKEEANAAWNALLSRIVVEDTEERLHTFYSCLYRCFLFPHVFHEIDAHGNPVHYAVSTGECVPGVMYTDNGFWDTFRTLYPLFSLLIPDKLQEMLQGYLNFYKEEGWLPKWVSPGERSIMPGALVDIVLTDAAVKGLLSQEQMELALEGMLKNANVADAARRHGRIGVADYCRLGYVPCDKYGESANNTLDAAYCDFCVAQMAALLGKKDLQAEYMQRSKAYRNLFDPAVGFIRGKQEDGTFPAEFSPIRWGGEYCEGAAWQNGFGVQHDIEGLAALYGGYAGLEKKLDELFATPPDFSIGTYPCEIHEMTEMSAADFGQCAISNQPSFHLPYLYAAVGNHGKAAHWVHRIMAEGFSADQYPGDEDNGSMAAWYVFGTLGIYPLCPGKAAYVCIGSPARAVEVRLGNGRTIQLSGSLPAVLSHDALMKGEIAP